TLVGHLFGLLPLGSPALRFNVLSCLLHAATVGLTTLITYRLLASGGRDGGVAVCPRLAAVGAIVGGLLLAFSTAFWSYALVAEVFPLNSFFAALLLFLLLEWERRPRRVGLFRAFALGCG